MRAIVVDDESLVLKRFVRLSESIPNLNVVRAFETASEALAYVKNDPVELAFLDVEMPVMNGIELAKCLREQRPDILIVFISAHDVYIRDSNKIGGDYYIVKPYDLETLELMMEKISLLAQRQEKDVYIQTFGTFNVMFKGRPIPLVGKAKEILAFIVTYRGKEVSNQTIYSTIWENRPYGNEEMVVFFNALRRLRTVLEHEGLEDLLISTKRGQMINTRMIDCDYYAWLDKNPKTTGRFEGEFLTEYSWAEAKLADLLFDW